MEPKGTAALVIKNCTNLLVIKFQEKYVHKLEVNTFPGPLYLLNFDLPFGRYGYFKIV